MMHAALSLVTCRLLLGGWKSEESSFCPGNILDSSPPLDGQVCAVRPLSVTASSAAGL